MTDIRLVHVKKDGSTNTENMNVEDVAKLNLNTYLANYIYNIGTKVIRKSKDSDRPYKSRLAVENNTVVHTDGYVLFRAMPHFKEKLSDNTEVYEFLGDHVERLEKKEGTLNKLYPNYKGIIENFGTKQKDKESDEVNKLMGYYLKNGLDFTVVFDGIRKPYLTTAKEALDLKKQSSEVPHTGSTEIQIFNLMLLKNYMRLIGKKNLNVQEVFIGDEMIKIICENEHSSYELHMVGLS